MRGSGLLRTIAATAGAIAAGAARMLAGSGGRSRRDVEVGDKAADFSLLGSDGRTYRLSDFLGRAPVVLAWFPKAFTGG